MNKRYWPVFIILGLPILIVISSSTLFFFKNELNVVNKLGVSTVGELIQPPFRIDEIELVDKNLQPIRFSQGEWHLLVLSQQTCDDCEPHLYQSKQMHKALGKFYTMMQRHIIRIDRANGEKKIAGLNQKAAGIIQKKTHHSVSNLHYLLVDPKGWVMMSYDNNTSEKAMMKDLKHLFTYVQ